MSLDAEPELGGSLAKPPDPGANTTASASPWKVERLASPWWKRTFDLALVLPAVVLCAIPALVIAGSIRVFMGPGVLFRQLRGGHGGEEFEILKFRTMVEANDEHGVPLADEERRHWFGSLLRSTSLDELPTLLNIVRGDMSIVGPRPLFAKYLPRYSSDQAARHQVQPGLTGLAQVSGRNLLSWEEKFELDLEYVANRSFAMDLRILFSTVTTVLGRSGADGVELSVEFVGSDSGSTGQHV